MFDFVIILIHVELKGGSVLLTFQDIIHGSYSI